jgi:hypothetical protein
MKVRKHDIILFTSRTKRGTELRTAIVTKVNGDGSFCHIGHHVPGYLETGSGRCYVDKIGTTPYGFYCAAEVIGQGPNPYYTGV